MSDKFHIGQKVWASFEREGWLVATVTSHRCWFTDLSTGEPCFAYDIDGESLPPAPHGNGWAATENCLRPRDDGEERGSWDTLREIWNPKKTEDLV